MCVLAKIVLQVRIFLWALLSSPSVCWLVGWLVSPSSFTAGVSLVHYNIKLVGLSMTKNCSFVETDRQTKCKYMQVYANKRGRSFVLNLCRVAVAVGMGYE